MKEVEYEQAIQFYRFYHDYRMKILNFTLAINAALLVIVIQHITKTSGRFIVSFFSLIATISLLGFEMRTIKLGLIMLEITKEYENDLDARLMTTFSNYAKNNGIPQRHFVWGVYLLIVGMWLFILYAVTIGII